MTHFLTRQTRAGYPLNMGLREREREREREIERERRREKERKKKTERGVSFYKVSHLQSHFCLWLVHAIHWFMLFSGSCF